jgi:hypothetical protein
MPLALVIGVMLFVSPLYAGMCGAGSDGSVTCTDDVGHNPSLQSLDKALVDPRGVTGAPEYSPMNNEMANSPRDQKSDYKWMRESVPSAQSERTTTFGSQLAKPER